MVDIAARPYEGPQINGDGTSEFAWRQSALLTSLPKFALPVSDLVVVVAPHPDDETLGLGGAIIAMLDAGTSVIVVTASDGEASHPMSSTTSPSELRYLRQNETRTAIETLARGRVGNALNVQLHLPDGHLAGVHEDISDYLARYVGPNVPCFATWEFDGHPDHEAVGRAARSACERTGAQLIEYPVWTWHWADVDDVEVPWDRARQVPLNDAAQLCKQNAIACYASQIAPLSEEEGDEAVLPPFDLAHFQRPFEVVFA